MRTDLSGGGTATPAPGTDVSPEAPVAPARDAEEPESGTKPRRPPATSDDDRITQERPPHW